MYYPKHAFIDSPLAEKPGEVNLPTGERCRICKLDIRNAIHHNIFGALILSETKMTETNNTIRPNYYRVRVKVRLLDNLDETRASTEVELEAQDLIEAFGNKFNLGNVIKYLFRAGKKSKSVVDDLKKVITYATFALEETKEQDAG